MLVYTFLPMRGAVEMVCSEISREVSLLSVSTVATASDTCTEVVWVGKTSDGCSVSVLFDSNCTPVCFQGLKPEASTVMVYVPPGRDEILKLPLSLLVAT